MAPYRCNPNLFEDYHKHQIGSGLPVFQGSRDQRGYGLPGVSTRQAESYGYADSEARRESIVTGGLKHGTKHREGCGERRQHQISSEETREASWEELTGSSKRIFV